MVHYFDLNALSSINVSYRGETRTHRVLIGSKSLLEGRLMVVMGLRRDWMFFLTTLPLLCDVDQLAVASTVPALTQHIDILEHETWPRER